MLPAVFGDSAESLGQHSPLGRGLILAAKNCLVNGGRTYANSQNHQSENAGDDEQCSLDLVDGILRRAIDSYSANKG
jgi:hypothetical protein